MEVNDKTNKYPTDERKLLKIGIRFVRRCLKGALQNGEDQFNGEPRERGRHAVREVARHEIVESLLGPEIGELRRAVLCVWTLVPDQLQSKPEILVERTVTTDMDYAENDVVLCYHGPLLYEAKVRLGVWQFRCGFR